MPPRKAGTLLRPTTSQQPNIRVGKGVSKRDGDKVEEDKRHHTMLIPPLKKSQPCDIKDRCGQYLRSTHSPEEAAAHADALKSLQDQRTKCISIVEPSAENIEILLRYWAQLALVENRVDWAAVNLQFTWFDVWKTTGTFSGGAGSRTTSSSLRWEQACILFNAAVLHCRLGERCVAASDGDQLKEAYAHFRKAAGMFGGARHLCSALGNELTADMSPDCLQMLENTCLAHGQKTFYQKYAKEGAKSVTLSTLAAGTADLYAAAHAPLAEATSTLAKGAANPKWAKELAIEMLAYRAASHTRWAAHMGEGGKVDNPGDNIKGREVCHLLSAKMKMEQAIKMAKDLKSDSLSGLNDTMLDLGKRLEKAQNENDKIYFDKVPTSVPDPEGKMMAKSEPLPDPQTAVGTDRFAHLVPAIVHKAALAYAAMRQDMVNDMIGKLQADTEAARARMIKITPSLEAVDSSEPRLPPRVREKIIPVQEEGGVKGLLERINVSSDMKVAADQMLEAASGLVDDEERKDAELRGKFGSKWTRSLSSTLNSPLKKDLEKHRHQMKLAAEADLKVSSRLSSNQAALEMIGLSLDQLDAKVAGSGDAAYEVQGTQTQTVKVKEIAKGLYPLVGEIEAHIQHRDTLRTAFTTRVGQEHPVRAVLDWHIQGVPHDEAFRRLLKAYDEWKEAFSGNMGDVTRLLADLEAGFVEFQSAAKSDEELTRREAVIKEISGAIDVYQELSAHTREGMNFYQQIQELIRRLHTRAEDFKCARDIEKAELIEQITADAARAAAPPPVSQAPPPPPAVERPPLPDTSRDEEIARQLAAGASITDVLKNQTSSAPSPPPAALPPLAPSIATGIVAPPAQVFAPPPMPPPTRIRNQAAAQAANSPAAPDQQGAAIAPTLAPSPAAAAPSTSATLDPTAAAPGIVQSPPPPPAAPPSEPTLPAGWEKKITPDGQVYYVDHNTQSTHWDPPAAAAAAAAPAQPSQAVGYVNTRPV